MTHSPEIHLAITSWLEAMVIGLNLCPFARGPYEQGRVHIAVSKADTIESAIANFLDELDALIELDAKTRSTTLLVTPHALLDFDDFLDAIAESEDILEHSGAEALVQLAHFHPDYLFEDVDSDDPSHYTNRAPYPILHLLRTEEVSDAVLSVDDIHAIPERNVALMREMGVDALLAHQRHKKG